MVEINMEEVKRWIEKAKSDLKAAKNSLNSKDYEWASFQAQQAAEKSLKALMLKKTGEIRKIHDLVILGKNVGLPLDLIDKVKELTLAYIYTRYPIPQKLDLKEKSFDFLNLSKEIVKWVEKNL